MLFAIYGTLRMGGPRNNILEGCKFVGFDYVEGDLYDTGFSFPALKLGGKETVLVELYDNVDADLEEVINKIEGYYPKYPEESLYVQQVIQTCSGKIAKIYVWNNLPGAPLELTDKVIPGDWGAFAGYKSDVPVNG